MQVDKNLLFRQKLHAQSTHGKKASGKKVSPQERADTETSPTSKPSKATSVCVCACMWVCMQSQEEHVCACDHMCMCEWAGGYMSVDKSRFSHFALVCDISSFKNTYKCFCYYSNMHKCAKPEQWYKITTEVITKSGKDKETTQHPSPA